MPPKYIPDLYDSLALIMSPYGPPPPVKGKSAGYRGIRDKPRRYREHMLHWLSMTAGAFEWSGLPDDLPPHYMEHVLQLNGWAALIKTPDGYAVAAAPVAAWDGEYTPYYQPRGIIVTNPYAISWDGQYTFGENAVLCRCTPQLLSVAQIIAPRVELQTETDVTFACAMQNLRLINLIKAKDTDATEAANLFLDNIAWGLSGIVTAGAGKNWSGEEAESPIEPLPISSVPPAYIQQLVEAQQYIHASLYNDLGIQSNWNAKREALNSDEVGAGDEALRPLIDIMLSCRQEFCEEVNALFGLNISVELSGAWATRKQLDETEEAQAEAAEAIAEVQEENAEEIVMPAAPEPEQEEAEPEPEAEEVSADDTAVSDQAE